MSAFPSYSVGTVSVKKGDTTIVGAGGPLWTSTANARAGDDIIIAGHIWPLLDAVDATDLAIDPWPFDDVPAGTPYKILQRSPLRFAGGQAAADVTELVGALNTEGLFRIVPAGATAPDPSLGEENQYALQPSTFRLWLKTGGQWVFQGIFKGFRVRGPYSPTAAYLTNDIVSQDGASYVALADNTGQPVTNAAVWALFATKGDQGVQGPQGAPGANGRDGTNGTNGAGYSATSATSLTIGTGLRTLVIQTGLAYSVGARVRISSAANFMEGVATFYDSSSGSLTVGVDTVLGSGTFTNWNVNIAGQPGTPQGQQKHFLFTAATGQTIFSGADSAGATLAYTPGSVEVALNGLWLPPTDYTATDGSTIVFPSGSNAGDVIYVFALSAFNPADALSKSQNGADIIDKPGFIKNLGISAPRSNARKTLTNNLLEFPYFNRNQWTGELGPSDLITERTTTSFLGAPARWFDYRALQLFGAAAAVQSTHPTTIPIDLTQSYRVGVWGGDSGGGNINAVVTPLDENGDALSALTIPLTLPAAPSATVGEVASTINAIGGAAPAWPSGTVGARIALQNPVAGTNKWIFAVYFIPIAKLPNTTFAKANFGGGTHEAAWDGSNLYVLSHTYNQLAKFDTNLSRQAIVTTASYPHDILVLGSDLWVISHVGLSLQQINRSALTVTNTFALNGSRHGFGIATDGTDLYLGIGDVGAGETPAIVKFTVSGSVQSVLSTDVSGGAANIPLQFFAGSIWSIHRTNGQVKRINPSGGATIATISGGIGFIYGLGNDGTFIYAVGTQGVAVINPASNTVVATYLFRYIFNGQSNAKVDANGAMWGCGINGIFRLDHARGILTEYTGQSGSPKWAQNTSVGVVTGSYAFPNLDMYQ
jgi:hypothetical protein